MKRRRKVVYKKGALTIMMRARERVTERQRQRNICSTSSCADRKMLALSSLIRDNGQVC